MCNVMIIIENIQYVKTRVFLVYVFCFVYKQYTDVATLYLNPVTFLVPVR